MEKPLIPSNENERLEALNRYQILDTEFEESYDDIAKIAASICDTPIALISLVDPDRQWFKAVWGLNARETPRDIAFCAHAIHNDDVMIVPDTLEDQRFSDNPLVEGDPNIRFYAGAPLITHDGFALGTLCTIDQKPRQLSESQIETLQALARQVCINLELRLNKRALTQLNERKNRLFSIISHDIRSPLYALSTIVENLAEGFESMEGNVREELIQHARRSVSTTLSVAENLLSWTNFEQGNFNFDPKPLSLESLLADNRPILELNAREKEITLSINSKSDSTVLADPTMLSSIIQNLVSNAVKFTEKGGEVSITVSSDENQVHIKVSDTGTGMDTATMENLFSIEKTYSHEGTEGEKGSGLGLTLCKQFAEKMDGELKIDSELGKGTNATVSLPLSKDSN